MVHEPRAILRRSPPWYALVALAHGKFLFSLQFLRVSRHECAPAGVVLASSVRDMVADRPHHRRCLRILENLSASVLLFDAGRRLIYVNPAAEMLFQLSARHLLGMTPSELFIGSGRVLEALIERAFESVQPYTERGCELCSGSGEGATVDCHVIPIEDSPKGRQILVELQQVDRQLRISRAEQFLSQHQATRALVRGLAHEIKNPLGGLRGAAQLLEGELPAPELREYTRIIIEEADRLQNLVNRMLGPNRPLNKQLVNLHQSLERVCALVEAEMGREDRSRRVEVVRDYDPSIPMISADPDQLTQAILNIVRNAVQAFEGKKGVGRVTLRTRALRQYTIGTRLHRLVARIEVTDNGPGIPAPLRDMLFFPMVTGRPGGSGLGLSIAQSLVNQHGGLIECQSRPGETTFSVVMPLDEPDADQDGARQG